jgi:hypothetical protein
MNILVIGNGFDLAHRLPTKYTDFLQFCKIVLAIFTDAKSMDEKTFEGKYLREWKVNKEIVKELKDIHYCICICNNKINYLNEYPYLSELYEMIQQNIWIEYFLQCNMYQKENWIDFEREISEVIKSLDNDMHRLSGDYSIDDDIIDLSNKFLNKMYSDYTFTVQSINSYTNGVCESITFKEIRNELLDDLNKLIRAFEIYLTEYVEKIEIQEKSPDIDELEVDFILSFNYTHIFSELYNVSSRSKKEITDPFDYIHGEADTNNTIESNNMVLGIDEYLSDERKNKDIDFIAFKKYYQRIHKQTGCKYKNWVDKIRQDYLDYSQKIETAKYKELQYIPDTTQRLFNKHAMSAIKREKCQMHNLFIFGHSLDITDKDILRDLILNDNVYTTIFYHNKDVMGQQIANLVKVIGQDELIRRTGGGTKTIEFKQQQDMVNI